MPSLGNYKLSSITPDTPITFVVGGLLTELLGADAILKTNSLVTLTPSSTASIVATYTVPVGKKLLIKGTTVGGDGDGEFTLLVNSTVQLRVRNSWCEKTVTSPAEYLAVAGDSVDLKALNVSTHGNTNDYYGSWWGYLITA